MFKLSFILRIVLILALCNVIPAFAGPSPTAADVARALEKAYAGIQDVQTSFTQKTVIAGINREQKGSGELFLKRPASATAMFRFNYTKPSQQIVSNGKQLWFYLPANRQVMVGTIADMFKGNNAIALSYLTGLGHVSRDFEVTFAKEPRDSNGNYQLELKPKKATPALAMLQLTVSAEAVDRYMAYGTVQDLFPIVASIVHDVAGNQTRIDYARAKVNKGLSGSKFTFKIPEGVEIIRQ